MRIDDKIDEIDRYLEELISITPKDFRKYSSDIKTKAACERYFEKIVESITDLAFLIIKDKGLRSPEDDKQAFDILAEEKEISKALGDRLKAAKGMRNILAHQYGQVDDEIVFEAITREIITDAKEFISGIEKDDTDRNP